MNFKTTILLIALLICLGVAVYFAREHTPAEKTTKLETDRKLLDVTPADVSRLTLVSADGTQMTLEKSGAAWRLTSPVAAPAETFEVDALLRTITDLKAHASVAEPSDAMGLSKPQYKIELVTTAGKTRKIDVGAKSAVGDNLYVVLDGAKSADVVGTELLERLEKPASTYRNPKLVNLSTADVKHMSIARSDGTTIELQKSGNDWRVTQPKEMPAETSEVDDLLFAVTGLRAVDWAAENQSNAAQYQLDKPKVTVALSATQPATQSAASSQPAVTIIKFGRYDDILRKNIFVATSDSPAVAKVAATVLDTLNKKPIELRDKKVVTIDAPTVSEISIVADVAATTQPTTKPASHTQTTIRRHVQVAAINASTVPATRSAAMAHASTAATTTAATTEPAAKWEIIGQADARKPAEDQRVEELLMQLNPLRADKYLESSPTTRPSATYTLTVTTQAAGGAAPEKRSVTIIDPGATATPVATFSGLSFEINRTLVDKLRGDFNKSAPGAARTPVNETFPETPR